MGGLTFVLHFEVFRQQLVLPVSQHKGQEGEGEGIQDADDGQDVGPAHCAIPYCVLVCPISTHAFHLRGVPAIGVNHAAQDHTDSWGQELANVS